MEGGREPPASSALMSLRPDATEHHRHRSDVDQDARMSDPPPSRVLPCPRIDDGSLIVADGVRARAERKHDGRTRGIVRRAAQAP